MKNNMSNNLKLLRQYVNLTQKDLSKSIDELQSNISYLESPNCKLNEASLRVLVKLSKFFKLEFGDLVFSDDILSIFQLKNEEERILLESSILAENFDYLEMRFFLNREKANPFRHSPIIDSILIRFEALVICWLDNDIDKAIELLENKKLVFGLCKDVNYQNLLLLNCLAGFYLIKSDYRFAKEKYLKLLKLYRKYGFTEKDRLYYKIIYNLALSFKKCGEFDLALSWIRRGIRKNRKYFTMYCLNDLYYLKAMIHCLKYNLREAKKALRLAKQFSQFLNMNQSYRFENSLLLAIEMNERGVWLHNETPLCELNVTTIEKLYVSLPLKEKKTRGRPRKNSSV